MGNTLGQEWERELSRLPGVTGAVSAGAAGLAAWPTAGEPAEALVTLTVESLDLRATTPALLAWVRTRGFALVSMRAEPVTLTDVFTTLMRRKQTHQQTPGAESADV